MNLPRLIVLCTGASSAAAVAAPSLYRCDAGGTFPPAPCPVSLLTPDHSRSGRRTLRRRRWTGRTDGYVGHFGAGELRLVVRAAALAVADAIHHGRRALGRDRVDPRSDRSPPTVPGACRRRADDRARGRCSPTAVAAAAPTTIAAVDVDVDVTAIDRTIVDPIAGVDRVSIELSTVVAAGDLIDPIVGVSAVAEIALPSVGPIAGADVPDPTGRPVATADAGRAWPPATEAAAGARCAPRDARPRRAARHAASTASEASAAAAHSTAAP